MMRDASRQSLVEKEESNVLETFANIHNHINTLEQKLTFESVEERDLYFETLFSLLENVAKGIEKLTWLQGTKTFSSDEEVEFVSPFDDPFSGADEYAPKEEKRSKLDKLIERVLDVLHKYGTKPESIENQSNYAMTLPTIGLEIYSMMKRYAMEFERCSANEITPFLENDCFFAFNQNVMNYLLRYFADTKDKTNTLIILKDMQQMQLGANVVTYNILIRYALLGEDKGQAVKLAKYMKQQGLEIDQQTKDLLRQHRLM
ncbi:predicted protein [Naegleria gruberi]|uniref:Predicted protein n=1 Tax=Naegleria gruberi TaxID=5762 RepID=D2VDV0_NAEGR|nr:uncharacterized protein NAEGRDRAFT_48743 [Naegleria gruberi]EFC44965.1 predicted protein [Naegleria gruberi]|eukprot:XP_002677709.1 predicted protein [Naegleria gruberi strain NEG-M]